MKDAVLRMTLEHAKTLGVAARTIADTAATLGLGGVERTQLEALLSEALTTVIADSFEGSDSIDVDVVVAHEPGELEVVLKQRGAPSTYVTGQLPLRLETLLGLGYADSMQFLSDGVRGSELRVTRAIHGPSLVESQEFVSDSAGDEQPQGIDGVVIRPIEPDDVVQVARLYFRTYGYTKIGSPWIYTPEVFRHKLAEGLHPAVVAERPDGRIVGHLGILRSAPDSATASGGPIAVDPDCRRMGLADRMALAFYPAVLSLGLRGTYSEAVTAHPASQKSALKVGGREVGLVLGRQPADLDFLGFDGPKGMRRAVMVLYSSFGGSAESTVHVPARYRDITSRIYELSGLPRTIESSMGRPPADLPAESRFTTELTAVTKFARIDVESYGVDFVEALQGLVLRFQREQFEVVTVHLPLADPLTCYFGAGLSELGLSFNAVFPEQRNGDHLVLGACSTEQDPETIAVASEFGRELRDFVVAERGRVLGSQEQRARSRASMARILDSL